MEMPGVSTVTKAASSALNWKTILVTLIVTIIITYLMSKIMKQTVTLTDASGNTIASGDIRPEFKLQIQKK